MTEDGFIPVESDSLQAVRYESGELFIRFHSGKTYAYRTVPEHIYDELMAAASKGGYFNKEIRPFYECRPEL